MQIEHWLQCKNKKNLFQFYMYSMNDKSYMPVDKFLRLDSLYITKATAYKFYLHV